MRYNEPIVGLPKTILINRYRLFGSDNELLVIHRLGVPDLPKGKIDRGEKPEETAIREFFEETLNVSEIVEGELRILTDNVFDFGNGWIGKENSTKDWLISPCIGYAFEILEGWISIFLIKGYGFLLG